MTYLEKAVEPRKLEIIGSMCPYDKFSDPMLPYFKDKFKLAPVADPDTIKLNKHADPIGFRGITCEQCWNQEIKED